MREFKYGVGVIAQKILLNLLLVKMSDKSLMKADIRSKNQKNMSGDGVNTNVLMPLFLAENYTQNTRNFLLR